MNTTHVAQLCGLSAALLVGSIGTVATPASAELANALTASSVKTDTKADSKASSSKAATPEPAKPDAVKSEAVKIGARQRPGSDRTERIAKVQAHDLQGKSAATLYVRNIPVLTFVGSNDAVKDPIKMGTRISDPSASPTAFQPRAVNSLVAAKSPTPTLLETVEDLSKQRANDPVWRASVIASKLNYLNREGLDAEKIEVSRYAGAQYDIHVNGFILATVDGNTILPDSTRDLAEDALQATNRLRRLLGNAKPLSTIAGGRSDDNSLFAAAQAQFQGWASWYGPGFNGNVSASGEIFNQYALTAAHRTLPFGTKVRVTNMDNGTSVVVRINDRGPYCGDRVIDLSMGAAQVLGLVSSGVAPVRLDILDGSATTTAQR